MKWFKHNQKSCIPTGVNPKDGCQVEFRNKGKFIGAAGSITWSSVLKYRVINKFIVNPMNKMETPRMMDKVIEAALVLVYINFGKVRAIKTLRSFKNDLSLVSAMETIDKYIPSKEYAKNLLHLLLKEKEEENSKPTESKAIDL